MPVTNWASTLQFTPAIEEMPASVDTVREVVRRAERNGRRVRAIGSAWSFTDVVHTTDVIVRTERLKAIHAFAQGTRTWGPNPEIFRGLRPEVAATDRRFVYFQAGVTVKELYTALDTPGATDRGRWAMMTQGASSGQTVVGAVSTGTHGADHNLPPLSSMVRGIHLIGPGGNHYWLERASGFGRVTDSTGPLAAINGLSAANILYDDEAFLAAGVGVGSLGIIVAVLVEAREQYGLSQRLSTIKWSAIKAAAREGRLFTHEAVPARHPSTAAGRRVNAIPEALEIFVNPYRTDDQYSDLADGDRNCLVVSRRRAIPVDNRPGAFDPPFRPPGANIDRVGLMIDVELHGPDRYRARVDEVMRAGRAETTGYPVAHSVLDTYDGTGPALPALGMEIVVPTTGERWIQLIDQMLRNFDRMVRAGKKLAGFMSLRFTRLSNDLMGMQNFDGGPRDLACHIEIFALKEINIADAVALNAFLAVISFGGSLATGASDGQEDIDHSGNLEGASDAFLRNFENQISTVDARMHWGQLHMLDRADVEDSYRLTLPAWRRVRTALAENGSSRTFSNGFTNRCGLESNHEVLAATSWGPGRFDVFTYDERGSVLQLWWNGRWIWSNLGNEFPGQQRFLGPLTACSWGQNRIDVFGVGRNGQLLQLWWNGRWRWSNLSAEFLGESRFAGPITACSWGEGRIDIFGLKANGNLHHVWYDRRWQAEDLPNRFTENQRFSGSISAVSWGRNRIDLIGLGRGKQILQMWWEREWHWGLLRPRFPGGQLFSGPPAMTSWGVGHLDLVGLGPRNNLLHMQWYPWQESDLGNGFSGEETRLLMADREADGFYRIQPQVVKPMFSGAISGTSSEPGRIDYFGTDARGRVRQLWWQGGWHWADLGRGW